MFMFVLRKKTNKIIFPPLFKQTCHPPPLNLNSEFYDSEGACCANPSKQCDLEVRCLTEATLFLKK